MTFAVPLLLPTDVAAPPGETWGPMLVVGLVVVAILAMVVAVGRVMRGRRPGEDTDPGSTTGSTTGSTQRPGGGDSPPGETTSEDPLPTDPPEGRP